MQKKIKLSAQLKKKLIQKIWIQKEIFENFNKKIKNFSEKIKLEKNSENKKYFLKNISELQNNFFSEIEKNIQEKMMNSARKWDFWHATILRNILFEFQNEIKSEQKYLDDLKEIFWWEIKNISCFDESENFCSKINFENWIQQKSEDKKFEKFEKNKNNNKNFLEKIFEKDLKILNQKIKNQKIKLNFFYKKLNKKDFWKIFKKIYNVNCKTWESSAECKNNFEKNLETNPGVNWKNISIENILDKNFNLKTPGSNPDQKIKINYYGIFEKQKNIQNKIEKFDEKKLENFFVWFIPVWKFDNKNYEIVFENPDENWNLFEKNFEEIFWDFIKYLWKNFSEKNFYIYWNSEIFEKEFNEFWIKKIKNLKNNLNKNLNKNLEEKSQKLSENFWIIPEDIAKFWPSKNKNSWFIWKFSTWEKKEKIKIPNLFLINWDEEKYKNILEKNLKKFSPEEKIFLTNKKFLEKISEKNSDWKKFLDKIFSESKRFLEKNEKIFKENQFLKNT